MAWPIVPGPVSLAQAVTLKPAARALWTSNSAPTPATSVRAVIAALITRTRRFALHVRCSYRLALPWSAISTLWHRTRKCETGKALGVNRCRGGLPGRAWRKPRAADNGLLPRTVSGGWYNIQAAQRPGRFLVGTAVETTTTQTGWAASS